MGNTIPSTDPQLSIMSPDLGWFKPWYTPNEMLQLGVYCGFFFSKNSTRYKKMGKIPKMVFEGIDESRYMNPVVTISINRFNVTGYSTYGDRWFNMNLFYKRLHTGWFDWYIGYFYGEVSPADMARADQWSKLISVEAFYINNAPYTGNTDRWSDLTFLPQRKQKLLEVSWDPTKNPGDYPGVMVKF